MAEAAADDQQDQSDGETRRDFLYLLTGAATVVGWAL